MIAYVGNAKKLVSDEPIEKIHQTVYAQLQESVTQDDYDRLVGTTNREIISTDSEAFRQTIAFFYDSRIIYIYTLALLMEFGMDPFYATYFISTVCTILSILLLATLLPRALPYGLCLALPFVVLSSGLLEVARFSSPDAMATLITCGMYWCLIRRNVLLLALFPLSIFVRADLILLAPLFLAYLYLDNHLSRFWIVVSGLLTLVAYLVLNHVIVTADAWSSLIGYNYGDKPTHPENYSFDITVTGYISYLMAGLRGFSYQPNFFMFCALTITGLFLSVPRLFKHQRFSNFRLSRDLLFCIVSCTVYFAVHFALFPKPLLRFYAAQYSLVTVLVLWTTLILAAENRAHKGGLE